MAVMMTKDATMKIPMMTIHPEGPRVVNERS
jgi:hypothetical protein